MSKECPHEASILRRSILVTACWIHKKVQKPLSLPPFSLVQLGDSRHPLTERAAVAAQFLRTNSCCLQPGLARRLKARLQQPESSLPSNIAEHPFWMRAWTLLASCMKLTVGDCELGHAHNRQMARGTFTTMAARSLNARAKRDVLQVQKFQQGGAGIVRDKLNKKMKKRRMIGSDPQHIHRRQYMNVLKEMGRRFNPCSKGFRSDAADRYKLVSQHEKSALHDQSSRLKAMSALVRRQKRTRGPATSSALALSAAPGASARSASAAGSPPEPAALVPLPGNTTALGVITPMCTTSLHSMSAPNEDGAAVCSMSSEYPVVADVMHAQVGSIAKRSREFKIASLSGFTADRYKQALHTIGRATTMII